MMPVELYTISEAPYGGITWAKLAGAAHAARIDVEGLERVCNTIGARIITYGGTRFVDFDRLGRSASWRQFMRNVETVQEALF